MNSSSTLSFPLQYSFLTLRKLTLIVLLGCLFLVASYALLTLRKNTLSMNDLSRWATIDSLVQRGSFALNGSDYSATVDRSYRLNKLGEKIYFSTKSAFMAAWIANIAMVLEEMDLSLRDMDSLESRKARAIILVLVNVFPFYLCVLGYWFFLKKQNFSPWTTLISLFTVCIGTFHTGYLLVLSNHTVAMNCIFGALLLFKASTEKESGNLYYLLACSLLAFAIPHEIQVSLLVPLALGFGLKTKKKLLLPAIIFIFFFFSYNFIEWVATQNLPRQMDYLFNLKTTLRIDEYWHSTRSVFDSRKDPWLMKVFHMSFGHHGIFSLTPIFLVNLYPLFNRFGSWSKELKQYYSLCFLLSLLVFLIFSFKLNNYGGVCMGFRWLFWLIPFWMMVLPYSLQFKFFHRPIVKALTIFALIVSSYSALMAFVLVPWDNSWIEKFIYEIPQFRTFNEVFLRP